MMISELMSTKVYKPQLLELWFEYPTSSVPWKFKIGWTLCANKYIGNMIPSQYYCIVEG
jgi:hypothetical protein